MTRQEMLEVIKKADHEYYDNDSPFMTDAEYDKLRYDYISKYGEKDLDYIHGEIAGGLKPFKHPFEVNSLDKVKASEADKLKSMLKRLFPVCIQKKYDGLTLVVYPKEKIIVTRGNGAEGEIIKNFMSSYSWNDISSEYPIRGELVMRRSVFEKINAQRKADGEELYKNPRNTAAGIIRSLEKSPYLDTLDFYVYDLMDCDWSVEKKTEYLKSHTPFHVADSYVPSSVEDAVDYIPKAYDKFSKEDIPIDGIVIKSNKENSLAIFGMTKHHPLNAFAWKAFQDGEITVIRNVRWQVGRSQVTCVAEFDPVEIDGTTVSQASLANIGIIKKLGLTIGATVLVNKANAIIPQVVQVLKDGDTPIEAPKNCPCCGKPLVMRNNVLYCENDFCRDRLVQNVDYLCSKGVINIKGLSTATIEKLVDLHCINDFFDVFNVDEETLVELEGFGEKSAKKVADNIRSAAKKVDLPHFIAACCVSGIALDVGNKLAEKFGTYEKLKEALDDGYDFSKIDGIGETTNEILHGNEFRNRYRILFEAFLNPAPVEPKKTSGKSYTFVITGKLSKSRSYFEELIKSKGSKVAGSISKNTDFLLCEDANSMSTKAKKARELGIKVLSEEELQSVL